MRSPIGTNTRVWDEAIVDYDPLFPLHLRIRTGGLDGSFRLGKKQGLCRCRVPLLDTLPPRLHRPHRRGVFLLLMQLTVSMTTNTTYDLDRFLQGPKG